MPPRRHDDYNAAWICALPLELAAACAMLDECHDPLPLERDSRDNNTYFLGRIGTHNVAIVCLPYGVTGTVSAARVVNQMLATFRHIKFGLMIGIGGGAPSERHDIRLGDVVVGKPTGLLGGVVQYDFGKTVQKGRFERTGMLNKPSEILLTAMSNLQARHFMEGHHIDSTIQRMLNTYPPMRSQYTRPGMESDRLYQADYEHPDGEQTCSACDMEKLMRRQPRPSDTAQPYVHYGLIASGDQVVRHGGMRDQLRKELDVLCFEMEAAGLMDSFPCLVIRGISDYADSHKNDCWQGYAAAAAAAYAKELMQVIPAAHRDDPSPLGGSPDLGANNQRFLVQEWLAPASVKDDLFTHQQNYMEGSCDWALQTAELNSFLATDNESGILRIGGAPGSGKSTLTGFVVRCLLEAGNPRLLYFFCKGADEGKNQHFQVLRTLLSQLLQVEDVARLFPMVDKLRLQSGKKHAESFATLCEAFLLGLTMLSTDSQLYIVVDALDECESGCLLASSVIDSLNAAKRPYKLLLTSREDPDLLDLVHRYQERRTISGSPPFHELVLFPSRVRLPVIAYVEQRVSQFQHIKATPLGYRVLKEVSSAADGSWLYARLILDEIERLPSAAAVARQLQAIPSGLMQLYQTIFATMGEALSPIELRLAQQVILWIDVTDFVLVGRGALDREILDLVFQAANSGDEVFDSIDLARKLCSPIISLKALPTQNSHISRFQINFVHHTAMQFVRQSAKRDAAITTVPEILRPQPLKALHRANTAVWYYDHSERCSSLLSFLREHAEGRFESHLGAYFEMAYGLWDAFCLETLPDCLDNDDLVQASTLCTHLTDFLLSERCLKWVEMAMIINYSRGYVDLFRNVTTALSCANKALTIVDHDPAGKKLPAFQAFSRARHQFFSDYAYVIFCTGPVVSLFARASARKVVHRPDGFENRDLAKKLYSLGEKWAYLYTKLRNDRD
ncbi:uncharacterized protein BJX67DRAFT_320949 [Aspergillus lucknowensis]|uniref:Nucleoside phosphorylase domain-containing protein n=1 Tax=Aspergillus lucknowensis TaxID=176173 RepID=A0ABR4LZ68_9EURO